MPPPPLTKGKMKGKAKSRKVKKRKQETAAAAALQAGSLSDTLQQLSLGEPSNQALTLTRQHDSDTQQQESDENQKQSSGGSSNTVREGRQDSASVTDSAITPNASTLNLAVANATPSSIITTSAPVPSSRSNHLIKFDTYTYLCPKQDCNKVTSPWDGSTVICPRCGPYSGIRYCCTQHLLDEMVNHWGTECLRYTMHHPCDPLTIHPRQVQGPPAMPNLCGWDNVERHRQVIYHAAAIEGEYFIFR